MLVLKIILFLSFIALIFFILNKINEFTYKKYKYEFFTLEYLFAFTCILGLAYWGYDWYNEALKSDGDILNGILIMVISSASYLFVLINNISKSSLFFGLIITILQTIVFLPFSFIVVIVIFLALLFLSGTRPVYNVN